MKVASVAKKCWKKDFFEPLKQNFTHFQMNIKADNEVIDDANENSQIAAKKKKKKKKLRLTLI